MSKPASLVLVLLALAAAGCADEAQAPVDAKRQFAPFASEVYPVLLRDCGFSACHGAPDRFFRVYGPGRVRLAKADGTFPEPFDTPTVEEQNQTFKLALSMIDENAKDDSLLLRKPLAVEGGGYGHLGVDPYGRDVYRTSQDSGYIAIARWVYSPPPMAMMPAGGAGGGAAP